ncbi:Lsr2 family protein [Streptomyces lavendulae]|uniref:histone-like nucleoid-structuring protein Lsr2 n=1 Tax=Streptomyces lavendulae TaxID=1914 RepID=UPI003402B7EE
MAKKTVTILIDDLTGQESQEVSTHTLVLDGVAYEIDLSPDSYDQLLEAFARFMRAGRRVKASRSKSASRVGASASASDTAEIRIWAQKNGYTVNDRGRVPSRILEAYQKAH